MIAVAVAATAVGESVGYELGRRGGLALKRGRLGCVVGPGALVEGGAVPGAARRARRLRLSVDRAACVRSCRAWREWDACPIGDFRSGTLSAVCSGRAPSCCGVHRRCALPARGAVVWPGQPAGRRASSCPRRRLPAGPVDRSRPGQVPAGATRGASPAAPGVATVASPAGLPGPTAGWYAGVWPFRRRWDVGCGRASRGCHSELTDLGDMWLREAQRPISSTWHTPRTSGFRWRVRRCPRGCAACVRTQKVVPERCALEVARRGDVDLVVCGRRAKA